MSDQFLPWNHPLRLEAEKLVREYNEYCQTHLPSDNDRRLAEMFLDFLCRGEAKNEDSETTEE